MIHLLLIFCSETNSSFLFICLSGFKKIVYFYFPGWFVGLFFKSDTAKAFKQ